VPLEHFTARDGCGHFRPTGPVTVPGFPVLLELALAECRTAQLTRLLVDITMLTHPPVTVADRYTIGTELAATWDRSIKLAVVGRKDQIDPERFARLVARNRGLQNIEAFETEEDALLWLGT
jgi:hypothetical protein